MKNPISRRGLIRTCVYSSAFLGLQSMAAGTFAEQPKRKLGVALLGLGHYAKTQLAPALKMTEHCELRGVITGTPAKAQEWKKQYQLADNNIYSYENMAEIAQNPDIDVIYVVTPTYTHRDFAVAAANAGKHVWCEKPMAMTVEECQAIIDACDKNKVRLSIGYRLLHEPNTRTVIDFAESKPFGDIKKVIAEAGYSGSGAPQDDWRMDRSKGGGALYDMGVYAINASRYATGLEPLAIRARFAEDMPDVFKKADSTAFFTLEFPNGVIAEGGTSVVRGFNRLRVEADKGWYKLKPMQSYTGVSGETSDGQKLNKTIADQQTAQMDNDALAILNNTPVRAPGIDGLRDVRIVQAALESIHKNGERVAIKG